MTNVLKKLIGYGYTDSNGIATLDYTEDGTDITTLQPTGETGYIGNGVGSVQVGAEIHDNSILVTDPYNVLDCTLYNDGLNTHEGIYCWITQPGTTATPSENGLVLDNPNTSAYSLIYVHNVNPMPTSWTDKEQAMRFNQIPFAIEFKVVSSSNGYLRYRLLKSDKTTYDVNKPILNGTDVRILFKEDGVSYYYNGGFESKYATPLSGGNGFAFNLLANTNIVLRDIKYYPI